MAHTFDPDPADLARIADRVWELLDSGTGDPAHPFHTPALATSGPDGPAVRTVVLRAADATSRTVTFHSDARSAKLEAIRGNPRVAWMFYDPRAKIQVRLLGHTTVHTADACARARWEQLRPRSRQNYRSCDAPGTPIGREAQAPAVRYVAESADESDAGFEYFAAITCRIDHVDWLQLRASGHRRAHFHWDRKRWKGAWVVP